MSEKEVLEVADKAKLIVNGYAFSKLADGLVSILNLNHPDCAILSLVQKIYTVQKKIWTLKLSSIKSRAQGERESKNKS